MHKYENIIKEVFFEENFSFSKHTTYGLGGNAKIAYHPKNEQEATAVYRFLQNSGEKFIILGRGSNVLVSDKFYDGAVICTDRLQGAELEGDRIKVLSGTSVAVFLDFCVKNGISGMEYLAGIPASIGGLAYMNGGINNQHIENNLLSVRLFDGRIREISNKNCEFGNKHSIMRDINSIILSVYFSIKKELPLIVKEKINYYINLRKNLPKGKSCGCVFKNPAGMSAGKLIDESGMKSLKIGGAEVSNKHANFIINTNGTAEDVFMLIKRIKKTVYEKKRINLEEEVVYIGEFNDTDS